MPRGGDGQRIAYHGVWLNLTRNETQLLARLLERPGRILSRSQIMESVWQDSGESLERTVDTHIKTLRAKLKTVAPNVDPIRTSRGTGLSRNQRTERRRRVSSRKSSKSTGDGLVRSRL